MSDRNGIGCGRSSAGRRCHNEFGQEIGRAVEGWGEAGWPVAGVMEGRWCRLERLEERHAGDLWRAFLGDEAGWTYLAYGPFGNEGELLEWVQGNCGGNDPVFYAVLVGGRAMGVASYLRIAPAAGAIEVGHIHFGKGLKGTQAATDAMYLMMRYAFELGYRRYEWKCDALNVPSRVAAQRFGFSFEGVFRNATVYKGRSRDTAWYSVTCEEWAGLRVAYEKWLAAGNFSADGKQKQRLSALTRKGLRNICDPMKG